MACIHYDKKPDGAVYGSVYESYREDGRRELPETRKGPDFHEKELQILDFGDAWFLDAYLKRLPFYQSLVNILPEDRDTVLSLIFYRILTGRQADWFTKAWYEGSYASIALPQADLSDQNISLILESLGSEWIQYSFLEEYLSELHLRKGTQAILTGCGGQICALDAETGMPLYFDTAANTGDVITAADELRQQGISIKSAILDTGYFSKRNARELFDESVDVSLRKVPVKIGSREPHQEEVSCVLLSSEELEEEQVLSLYSRRQQVRRIFDMDTNCEDMGSISIQNEEEYFGHLLICFIAAAVEHKVRLDLAKSRSKKAKNMEVEYVFRCLRNQKCKVYKDFVIPQTPRPEERDVYDIFKFQVPERIAYPIHGRKK